MSAILGAHTSDRSQKPASAQLSLPSGAATTEEEEEEERGAGGEGGRGAVGGISWRRC